MNADYPKYLSNNTRLVLYILREHLPADTPMKMTEIIKLVEKKTHMVGMNQQPITIPTIQCAVRNQASKTNGEYKKVGCGIYVRIGQTNYRKLSSNEVKPLYSANGFLSFAYDAVIAEFPLDPLDARFSSEEMLEAREKVREILGHIKVARELVTSFPYPERLSNYTSETCSKKEVTDMIVKDLSHNQVQKIKQNYKPKTRIELIAMYDNDAVSAGVRGSVNFVDDKGQIHTTWDNGRTLSIVPQIDKFKKVNGLQPLFDFIKAHNGYSFDLYTPGGYVYLTPEKAVRLLNGEDVDGHLGDSDSHIKVKASELSEQYVYFPLNYPRNKTFHIMTCLESEEEING